MRIFLHFSSPPSEFFQIVCKQTPRALSNRGRKTFRPLYQFFQQWNKNPFSIFQRKFFHSTKIFWKILVYCGFDRNFANFLSLQRSLKFISISATKIPSQKVEFKLQNEFFRIWKFSIDSSSVFDGCNFGISTIYSGLWSLYHDEAFTVCSSANLFRKIVIQLIRRRLQPPLHL